MKNPDLITDVVAPLGPNARAMLDKTPCAYCHHERGGHHEGVGVCCVTLECPCRDYAVPSCRCGKRECFFCRFDSRGEQHVSKQPSQRPTVLRLLADTKAVILRRRQECYGGLAISDEQADELSRALVQHLLGSYEITGVAP